MDFSAFVGLPWKDRGRGPDGYDCWGVFMAAFTAGTGILLPGHEDGYASSADKAETARLVAGDLGDWLELGRGEERGFDAALMKIAGGFHIGLIVRRGLMLHMPRQKSSVIEPIGRFDAVLTGLFRHKGLQ
jgi:cell wall-associated NlpC family hydrolase